MLTTYLRYLTLAVIITIIRFLFLASTCGKISRDVDVGAHRRRLPQDL